jgi:hypothetical protein
MNLRSLVSVVLCAVLSPQWAPAAELPVRTVVLYKHGVGYFERSGTLGPGESARLDFKADEMNDVLKSITVSEQSGKVTGLRYDSSIPLSQKLTEFPFAVEGGAALSGIIDQFKGARIAMELGSQKVAGTIVSARLVPGEKDRAEREQVTLLLDSGELRNIDLGAATAIRFTDAKLQLQFTDYLAALSGARSRDKRSVYIDSTDAQSRNVKAAYIMPMPAWKSSYRISFGKDDTQPMLEGWAIVDNTTGEDWTNVRLSLISGKPISFVSQLYAPKYVSRVGAELAEDRPVAPTVYSGAVQNKAAVAPGPAMAARMGQGGGVAGGSLSGVLGGVPSAGLSDGLLRSESGEISSTIASSNGTEIADLFEYSIAAPVTVKKDESAMMPFLQQRIAARKLVIYSDASRPNPFNAAELTNNTGKTLDGGPITVYDAGAYAGEALVETVKNADKRFINYGVDLGTRIATNLDSQNTGTFEVRAHNGLLLTKSAVVDKRTYSVHNVDARPKTLIIEHPVRGGYQLMDTPKPLETAGNVYRFEVKVPAGGELQFPVTEQHVYDTQISVSSLNPDALLVYVRNPKVSEAARKQLQQIAGTKSQITGLDDQKRSLTDEIGNLTRDEERNRQNITSLSNVSGQQQVVQDYARRLADQETRIAKLRDQAGALDQQRVTLQTQLNRQIENLDF